MRAFSSSDTCIRVRYHSGAPETIFMARIYHPLTPWSPTGRVISPPIYDHIEPYHATLDPYMTNPTHPTWPTMTHLELMYLDSGVGPPGSR